MRKNKATDKELIRSVALLFIHIAIYSVLIFVTAMNDDVYMYTSVTVTTDKGTIIPVSGLK